MVTSPIRPSAAPVRRLRPVQSPRLPRELQADRVWQFTRDLADGVRNPTFRTLVQEIDGSPWHPVRTVRVLEDGEATFAAIGAVIAAAKTEILLEMYILRDDDVGTELQALLCAAVARGVRVCVLADALGSIGTSRAFWRTLEAAGNHGAALPPVVALAAARVAT